MQNKSALSCLNEFVTYRGMVVGKSVIDVHILEEPPNVVFEEAFNFRKVELGVNKNCPDIGLDNVRKALDCVSLDAVKEPPELPLADSSSWSSSP